MDTRWTKTRRDLTGYGGRALALLIALSVGIFTVATMLGAYGVVSREIVVNYATTNPASATIEVDAVTPAVLATAKAFPGIAAAEPRAVVEARAKVGDEWMRMLLFVVDDFDAMRLNVFTRDSGAWPPPTGGMLIERQAIGFLKVREGGVVTLRMPHGSLRTAPVSGVVHDTTLAPAWQEQTGYGYITRATLAGLGEPPVLDELRVLLDGDPMSTAVTDAKALELAKALQTQGVEVHSVKVPPPGQHPHQGQILISLGMFLTFATLALLLSAILAAAVLSAILARQVREIAIMKAIGARSRQIGAMYGVLLLVLGGASLAVGLPLGIAAAKGLAQKMADTMNFTVTSSAIPGWVYAVLIGAGLLLPLLVSLPTIVGASRKTVREALGSFGAGGSFGARRFDQVLARFGGVPPPYLLAIRNMFRRRGRLVLALVLLSAGGGVFITALNVRDGWRAMADHVTTDRFYDADFLLSEAVPISRIEAALAAVEGIDKVEVWGYSQTAFAQQGRIDVMRTYPDRGHGGFTLFGVPPQTKMIRFPVMQGRWLANDDIDAVVLTPKMLAQIPAAKIGDRVLLSIAGRPTAWRIVGLVLEVGGGGAYVSRAGYAKASGSEGMGSDIRVIARAGTAQERARVVRAAEQALDSAAISVERSMPLERLHTAMIGHVEVPVAMLVAASVLLATIGGLGLASMMTVNVLERTRELGVMKALGATPAVVLKVIVTEGVLIAAISWFLALLVSLPLTRAVGLIAAGMFGAPLPFTVSVFAAAAWLALALVIAVAASAAPASRAARLVVREALAYE
ncbi:ABC transporter permease [Phenylobacterium sp.]|uniref:ABC transporter permease n=1 Tax=Phenylobacterium sp. TaxID=1871053 RepID=UPI00273452AD|nr:ABC transporter permease [Phenylobacterium sp.]MDP3853319.1 ABC transporter permease [Phenylobacterium sp.]